MKSQLRNIANSGIHLTINAGESLTKQFDNNITLITDCADQNTIISIASNDKFTTKTVVRFNNVTHTVDAGWNWIEILEDKVILYKRPGVANVTALRNTFKNRDYDFDSSNWGRQTLYGVKNFAFNHFISIISKLDSADVKIYAKDSRVFGKYENVNNLQSKQIISWVEYPVNRR